MKNILYTTLFVLALFVVGTFDANAKRVSGYIITNDNDTLKGIVNVYDVNLNKTLIVNLSKSINAEMAFVEVSFKQEGQKRYKTYKPEQIKEYGFTYGEVPYLFKSFIVKSNTFVLNEREQYHFLLLISNQNGHKVYKHQKYRYDDKGNELTPYYVSYVEDKDGKLIKLDR